jgi:hypothetical protein
MDLKSTPGLTIPKKGNHHMITIICTFAVLALIGPAVAISPWIVYKILN